MSASIWSEPACAPAPAPVLSHRERKFLLALAEGRTLAQASELVGVAHSTGRDWIERLAAQLETRRASGAIGEAVRRGLLAPEPVDPGSQFFDRRERELVKLLADGGTEKEIARATGLSRRVTRTALAQLSGRLRAASPAQLVWRGAAYGLVPERLR